MIFTDSNNDGTPEIIQESDYYPFGMRHDRVTTATNHYLYNGKELNEDLGLDWYDYGFRWYDAQLGRFHSVDPIIENFPYVTPYNYAENKPINSIDLWGLQSFPMYNNANNVNGDAQDFVDENPKTAAGIAVVYLAPLAIALAPEAVLGFIVNETKDEVLSQATGGLSDYADVTKMATKGGKKLLQGDVVDKDLFAFGNAKEPRAPREGTDFEADVNGIVKGQSPTSEVKGASTFDDASKAPVSGQFHKIEKGTKLPDGMGVKADGTDVGGIQPSGHHTIYNKTDMTPEELTNKFKSIPSTHVGKKDKNGNIKWKE